MDVNVSACTIGNMRVVVSVDAIVVDNSVTSTIGSLRVVVSAGVVDNSVTEKDICGNVIFVLSLLGGRITMTSI